MRCIRCFLLALCGLLLVTASASSQSKDLTKKDKPGPSDIGGKTLKQWMHDLRDPTDPTIRQTAIRTVIQFGRESAEAIPSLTAALKESDASVRNDAAVALSIAVNYLDLSKSTDREILQKVVDGLRPLVLDEQRAVRIHACGTLAALRQYAKSAIPNLTTALKDSLAWEVRKAAADALGAIALDPKDGPDATAMKALIQAMSDPCAPVRLAAINALSMLGISPRKADMDAEKTALEGRLKDRDRVIVLWARTLLMFLDEKQMNDGNLKRLANDLSDTELRVRCQAASALGALGKRARSKVPDLISALNDREDELAMAAASALGHMDDPGAIPALLKVAHDDRANLQLRCIAIRSTGSLGDKSLVPELVRFLSHKEATVQLSAIFSLAALGELGKDAIPDLKKLTESENEVVGHTAREAIKAINSDKGSK
jgi:HEAT repeat protein